MRISEYFSLGVSQNGLDFVDVNFTKDVELFIDPCWIHTNDDEWCIDASETITDFFNHILELYENGNDQEARELFDYAHEPNEICFGLSSSQPEGTGASREMLSELFDDIRENNMIENGLIQRLEDVHVFVDGFGQDRLSDLVTNIIRKHLVDFTIYQCGLWGIETNTEERQLAHYWNRENHTWEECNESPLVIDGKDILLVPKSIVVKNYRYTAGQYCTHFVLERRKQYHLENNTHLVERTPRRDGTIVPKVYKKAIRKEEITDSGLNEKQYVRSMTERNRNLIQLFRDEISNRLLNPETTNKLNDETLEEYLDL
ncbi:hypothetical protein AQ616_09975 [Oceanobacillus sp. E9]|uniref:hypothetical protein n=1 Tax=Oceanobacillus sp. E9 TaxID=1742575 RepID=UPI00084E4601|nr:hypothetical protein [Oceanobacillus sp. E9]OEH54085.1 hypothetical protein AQ616_09975 [Oceanobacillus sp. E9]